ncbi:N-acetylmuramic acid 6-phosphate etherase [uncultured Lactobacillus sp.]|uniref:N-acetylmuramic acid 6-phosphate etherase n=1 Tax=uncultured Lactobacillus sp. TaxID=153152 RepID=UPI0026389D7D|nr:N-acetylmuramic acid 6-phosphate etherase [uncultured Lactobacillus sp.]
MSIKDLTTEQRNPASMHIDTMSTLDIVKTINNEDKKIADAVGKQSSQIAKAIDLAAENYHKGGRLIYIGAGTSGRLGVLDAVELVPTYGIKPERAVGLIAGGEHAIYKAVEGAEDSQELAQEDLKKLNLNSNDIVIGLAASGRTPYVIGGLKYAQEIGSVTISVACVAESEIGKFAQAPIEAVVGPEVVTGSTRMKAGTAQKMILNMISTGVMIKQGKVYENVMIDVQPTNEKLVDRSERIIVSCTHVDKAGASEILKKAHMNVPLAIVMAKTGFGVDKAARVLDEHDGNVSQVLSE